MAKRKQDAAPEAERTPKRTQTQATTQASLGDTKATIKPYLISKRASLLGLAGELRNRIYEYVMDDAYDEMSTDGELEILISPTCFTQPAICRTSQQLRNETLALFYSEFFFNIEIVDLEFGPHPGHFVWTRQPYMIFEGKESWSNFKEWLSQYWGNRDVATITDGLVNETSRVEHACRPAFDMVRRLADAGVAWDVVEDVLESYKDATEVGDSMWNFWDE